MTDTHDSDGGYQWLNVKILESAGARGSMTEDEKDLHQIGGSMVSDFWRRHDDIIIRNLDERMVPYSDLLISNRDDRRVYELTLQGGLRVVCKTFTLVRIIRSETPEHVIRNDYKRVLRELHIWSKIKHENVVELLHVAMTKKDNSVTLISMKLDSNLRQALKDGPEESPFDYIRIIKGIAAGLQYLHNFYEVVPDVDLGDQAEATRIETRSSKEGGFGSDKKVQGIVHGDVKCINVLLRHNDSTPVITDFGVSHEIREGTFTRQLITTGRVPIGTLQWMAPELLTHESGKEVVYTREADVWSFGMTIYELITNRDPWYHLMNNSANADDQRSIERAISSKWFRSPLWPQDIDWQKYFRLNSEGNSERVTKDKIPTSIQRYLHSLKSLCGKCYSSNPGRRPSMDDVLHELNAILVVD